MLKLTTLLKLIELWKQYYYFYYFYYFYYYYYYYYFFLFFFLLLLLLLFITYLTEDESDEDSRPSPPSRPFTHHKAERESQHWGPAERLGENAVLLKRMAWALFVLLFSTLCCSNRVDFGLFSIIIVFSPFYYSPIQTIYLSSFHKHKPCIMDSTQLLSTLCVISQQSWFVLLVS